MFQIEYSQSSAIYISVTHRQNVFSSEQCYPQIDGMSIFYMSNAFINSLHWLLMDRKSIFFSNAFIGCFIGKQGGQTNKHKQTVTLVIQIACWMNTNQNIHLQQCILPTSSFCEKYSPFSDLYLQPIIAATHSFLSCIYCVFLCNFLHVSSEHNQ